MADETSTATVGPPLLPPLLEVGYNYTWPFNRYGTSIGPRDIQNDPPTGKGDATPVFTEPRPGAPLGTLDRNLKKLRDELRITKVRMFLMGNAFNYGARPISPTPSGKSIFFAPPQAHPLFAAHFRAMLKVFADNGMQIIPSLIDFGAFYPFGDKAGAGRTSVISSQRLRFLETVLAPLLKVSAERGLRETVFAWEVVNEPVWNTVALPPGARPHTGSTGPDVSVELMASFIRDCLLVIEGNGFQSTVGHRFLNDLKGPMPTGTLPQFHYYALDNVLSSTAGVADPSNLPTQAELNRDSGMRNAFVGEFATQEQGKSFFNKGPGRPWPDCKQQDTTLESASFERLKVLAKKGYRLAFVWPDRPDGTPENDRDELKLTQTAQDSIKRFTRGRFPDGIPG